MADAVKITVTYDDGTVKELDKGLVWHFEENEDTPESLTVTADMVNMAGRDLYTVVNAAVEFGLRIGMFGGEDDG